MIAWIALALVRHRAKLRIAFWLYAIALFTATHWPALEVRVPYVERPDLIAHFTVFGAWFSLLWASGYVGNPLAYPTIIRALIVACLYAGLDEGLQAIPWVRRHCAWDDYAANCIGITIAATAATIFTTLARRRPS